LDPTWVQQGTWEFVNTTPALIQLACSSGDAITWRPNQVHLLIFNTLHFTLSVGGE
jgi:hypothetical protein